jgi:hypothetical protein
VKILFFIWLAGATVMGLLALMMALADSWKSVLRFLGLLVLTVLVIVLWPLVLVVLAGIWIWFEKRGGLK